MLLNVGKGQGVEERHVPGEEDRQAESSGSGYSAWMRFECPSLKKNVKISTLHGR
jgi:hypothetical protein